MHLGHGAGHCLFMGIGQDFFLFLWLFGFEEVVRGDFDLDEAALDRYLVSADGNNGAFAVYGVDVHVGPLPDLVLGKGVSPVFSARHSKAVDPAADVGNLVAQFVFIQSSGVFLQIFDNGFRLHPEVPFHIFRFFSCLFKDGVFPPVKFVPGVFQGVFQFFRLMQGFVHPVLFFVQVPALLVEAFHDFFHVMEGRFVFELDGPSQNHIGHAEAAADVEGVAVSCNPDNEAVGRSQGLFVEFHESIFDSLRFIGQFLHFTKMGGNDGRCPFHLEVFRNGLGQGSAFHRICAGAQFVQQHQILWSCRWKEGNELCNVAGKGGEVILDALFIADDGIDMFIHGEHGPFFRRNEEARLVHEG